MKKLLLILMVLVMATPALAAGTDIVLVAPMAAGKKATKVELTKTCEERNGPIAGIITLVASDDSIVNVTSFRYNSDSVVHTYVIQPSDVGKNIWELMRIKLLNKIKTDKGWTGTVQ